MFMQCESVLTIESFSYVSKPNFPVQDVDTLCLVICSCEQNCVNFGKIEFLRTGPDGYDTVTYILSCENYQTHFFLLAMNYYLFSKFG